MACSTGLCFLASIPPLSASCSSGSSCFLMIKRVSSAPSLSRHHKAKEAQRRRQAEAINGALAVIGLTAGLLVEAQTGKDILGQLAGYLTAISSLFGQ
ncbi:hypothetical protein ZEAMMB73_Zm00001d051053 [Zea mays]|uniref:Uncharacterized protein n=1 Tax=Zea mays TaxID=4577 RepID=A0A1D6Q4N4_MAIZE|nr:hypothetical protein ZEAMMB73_Zm00001d051053 [Zea mays]